MNYNLQVKLFIRTDHNQDPHLIDYKSKPPTKYMNELYS